MQNLATTRMMGSVWISILLLSVVGLHAGEGVGLSNLFSLDLRPVATSVAETAEFAVTRGSRLSKPYPNPFNSSATLSYQIFAGFERRVEISIFGVDGQRVRRLHSGGLSTGIHEIHWDGRSDAGRSAGSGVYFAVITSLAGVETRKLVFLR